MRYAVLGAAGQLGRDLVPRLDGDVSVLNRERADLTQPETLTAALYERRPDVVVNCAADNFVDRAESQPQSTFATNAWGVRELALRCRELDCVLVHFSTDYVFGLDLSRSSPYREGDAPGPVSVYGSSKLLGEYFVRALCPKHFVIRTCGLYGVWGSGGKGGNFVETMLRIAGERKPLRVVADQTCTPSYTVDVAAATIALLRTGRYGLYHLTNAGECSWYDFARVIFEIARLEVELSPVTSQEYKREARRPAYSVLTADAYAALGLPPLRSWRQAVAAYLEERRQKPR